MDAQRYFADDERRLRRGDYLVLLLVCGVLFGFSLLNPRLLNTHETTHCLNVHEMFNSGDWLIATYGGRPWLERPPVPHWLTAVWVWLDAGDLSERAFRLGSIAFATLTVLVFAWAMAGCFGRRIGLMTGIILATMREFAAYAVGPEADIYLAGTVTIAGALLIRLLFDPNHREQRVSFLGGRSWQTAAFFILLGLTNAMKGPLFGMFFILLPLGAYFVCTRKLRELRPLIWLWGWLLTLLFGAAWPLYAYWRFPDIVEMWAVDYGVRWNSGYLGEPYWYYFAHQPWNLFPWAIPVLFGAMATARLVWLGQSPALRYLWCWALVPLAFFSLFKGKHHHYMLSCLAPAAVLAAYGSIRIWQLVQEWPNWLRRPWASIPVIAVPVAIAIYLLQYKLPGPSWVPFLWMAGAAVAAFTAWWAIGRRNPRSAFAGCCVIVVATHCAVFEFRTRYAEQHTHDREFLRQVLTIASDDRPLLVLNDNQPLNTSWPLFYLGDRARLLHNETFLRDERIDVPSVYLLCRVRDEPRLTEYGTLRTLAQSVQSRYEKSIVDRYTLYELTFHPGLERLPADVRITPMQATGRAPGPYLQKPAVVAQRPLQ